MGFTWSERHIQQFFHDGYTIFRGILPPTLIADLRRVTDHAREIARKQGGPQTQRLQPVGKYPELDQKPFQDYAQLPALNDAIHRTLSPRHFTGSPNMLGILLEPAQRPWATAWHRDIRENSPGIDPVEYLQLLPTITHFVQVNCALWDDPSMWFVPGSHLRTVDLESETHAANTNVGGLSNADRTPEEQERFCLDYCNAMPGGMCVYLNAGDFAMYRSVGWHLGNYTPYRKRATLHDLVFTPEYEAWSDAWQKRMDKLSKKIKDEPTTAMV